MLVVYTIRSSARRSENGTYYTISKVTRLGVLGRWSTVWRSTLFEEYYDDVDDGFTLTSTTDDY